MFRSRNGGAASHMDTGTLVDTGTLAVIIALLVQSVVAGIAAGRLAQLVKTQGEYIKRFTDWKHDIVTPRLFQHDELWGKHKQKEG